MKLITPSEISDLPRNRGERQAVISRLRKADSRLNLLFWIYTLGSGLLGGAALGVGRLLSKTYDLPKASTQLFLVILGLAVWMPMLLYFGIYPRIARLLEQEKKPNQAPEPTAPSGRGSS